MKTAEVAYIAECKDCLEKYGFTSAGERDAYLSTWHSGHRVVPTTEKLA